MHRLPIVLAALLAAAPLAAQNTVEPHVRALLEAAPATPGGRGFLTVALNEAAIARLHSQEALRHTDLAGIKAETAAALHAIDPATVAQGPGLGYGLRNALAHSVIETMRMQRLAPEGGEAGLRAAAASVAAQTALTRTDEATEAARMVLLASDPVAARAALARFDQQLANVIGGLDADGNGDIAWNQGEGGLQQAWNFTHEIAIAEGMQVAAR